MINNNNNKDIGSKYKYNNNSNSNNNNHNSSKRNDIDWDDLIEHFDVLGDDQHCHQACQSILNVIQILDSETIPNFMKYFLDNIRIDSLNLLARKEVVRLIGFLVSLHKLNVIDYQRDMVTVIFKVVFDNLAGTSDVSYESIGIMVKYLITSSSSSSSSSYSSPTLNSIANIIVAIIENVNGSVFRAHSFTVTGHLMRFLECQRCQCHAQVVQALAAMIVYHNTGGAAAASSSSFDDVLSSLADIGCRYLASPDWLLRKASCELLSALATRISKEKVIAYQQQCLNALEQCKYDKIKSVRDLAITNISLYKSIVITTNSSSPTNLSPILTSSSSTPSSAPTLSSTTPTPTTPNKIALHQNQYIPSPLKKASSLPTTPNLNKQTTTASTPTSTTSISTPKISSSSSSSSSSTTSTTLTPNIFKE
ncbi:hypothetical protein PPL_00286 [Heterostelium album PN500]|uniref:TORTIFOLIA1/SINE1-2 N-terminal domain-containing protein n=1 Tax=Heterostelium pallidum (strain ATCC 26659 / Pp 5 / PN500) TaxID=670386 RepID=D3AW19_HETP5|nr:hypothetical protein PPL_00286 [Heterostelium album PN500]EFA86492.1 hypothetical protein PPL_00286 [Heterostelium album PN500]|eukprot:XP_020438597.1 hypothetical protein PPL_00286 [Heterostelium album PN500]